MINQSFFTNQKSIKIFFWFSLFANLIPNLYFTTLENINIPAKIVSLLLPLGIYLFIFSSFKNLGKLQLFIFPLLFIHSFQIVLFFLFGKEIIAADMFLNVATTNPHEVSELLENLILIIIIVSLLYIFLISFAILHWLKKLSLEKSFRKKMKIFSFSIILFSIILTPFSKNKNSEDFSYKEDVYPINAIYNLSFAIDKWYKIRNLETTTAAFKYCASRETPFDEREIYVLVIGETSRADNWELYGYNRNTNPKLKGEKNMVLFKDALTQSNTTHKSVSIMLSDASAENYSTIYSRKGILTAFKEAGFKTAFLSNQAKNGSFIEFFSKEADVCKYIRSKDTTNRGDMDLIPLLNNLIDEGKDNLFVVIHSYGSHFNYKERYTEEFSIFKPDEISKVKKEERETLVNAFDNSILYTDAFLQKVIETLKESATSSALLYASDHGEDIFDDDRNRFLHASPSPTYYQLRIPMLFWYSEEYEEKFPKKVEAIKSNRDKAVSTNAIFHTLLDMSSIQSPYLRVDLSLTDALFQSKERKYLNDHDKSVPYLKMNLKKEDLKMIKKHNLKN